MRQRLARIFGHEKPDAGIERRLDATRQQLTTAAPDEQERLRTSLAGQWQTRFADLLADHPEVAAELRALLSEVQSYAGDTGGNVTNTISRTVTEGPVLMGLDFADISIGSLRRQDPDVMSLAASTSMPPKAATRLGGSLPASFPPMSAPSSIVGPSFGRSPASWRPSPRDRLLPHTARLRPWW